MTKSNNISPDFEKSLAELETIVNRMEQGEQPLEQTLEDFERGMELSQACQLSLQQAEQRVEILVKKHGRFELEPLEQDTDADQTEDIFNGA